MSEKTDNRFYREAGADCVDFPSDNARDRIIEKMARAMNIATDGHDRYWSGYVKSATAAHKVVADHLAITRPASQPKALSQHHRDVLGRLEMLLEACQVENGIDHERSKTYAEALRALLEAK